MNSGPTGSVIVSLRILSISLRSPSVSAHPMASSTASSWEGCLAPQSATSTPWSRIQRVAVRFSSPVDGSKVHLSPERSMEVQRELGSDKLLELDAQDNGKT